MEITPRKTGVLDSNGKELIEGDIVLLNYLGVVKGKYIVEFSWKHKCFQLCELVGSGHWSLVGESENPNTAYTKID